MCKAAVIDWPILWEHLLSLLTNQSAINSIDYSIFKPALNIDRINDFSTDSAAKAKHFYCSSDLKANAVTETMTPGSVCSAKRVLQNKTFRKHNKYDYKIVKPRFNQITQSQLTL